MLGRKILLSASIALALTACSEKQTVESYLTQAEQAIKANKVEESVIALKNAIQLDPKSSHARFELGRFYLNQGAGDSAVKELERALALKYSTAKVVPLLARAYILTELDDNVIGLDTQTQALSNEVKVHYLAYKTFAAIRTQNMPLAKETVELANTLLASNSYTFLATAYLHFAQNELEQAKTDAARVLTVNELQPDALLLSGQIHTATGEHEEATKRYLKYAQAQPKSDVILMFIAQSLLQEGKFADAEKYADTILAVAPRQPFAHYVKAMAKFETKDYQASFQHAETALMANFNQNKLKLIAGVSAYMLTNFEQTHHHLSAIIKYLTPEHPARKMFAVSQFQLGLIDDMSETLSGFSSTKQEDANFLSTLSYQLTQLGAFEEAKVLANKASDITQNNTEASADAEQNVRDGILKLMLNDPSGMKNLQMAVKLEPDSLSAELALAYAAIQTGDFEQALAISQQWKEKYPDKPGSYNVLGAVHLKKGELEKAKEALQQGLVLAPKNNFALVELTSLAHLEGDREEAKRLSNLAVTEFPNNVRILKQHYAIFKDENAFAKIKALFESNQANLPYGMLYSEVLLDRSNDKAALDVLDSFDTSIASPERLWQLKIIAQRKLGNEFKIQQILENWIDTNPYHIQPVLLLVDILANSKREEQALKRIEQALEGNHKGHKMLRMAKMQLLLNSNQLIEAKSFYQKLTDDEFFTEENKVLSQGFEGRIFLLEKNYAQAVPLLAAFYTKYPSSQNAMLRAIAQQGNKQSDDAIADLEKHLLANKKDDRAKSLLANFYLQGQSDKAINIYSELLATQPNNVVVLNNLAWLSLEKGNVEQALSYAEKAYELAPQVPNVSDTYAQTLVKTGDKRVALVKSKEAYELSGGQDVDIMLNYIEILTLNKRTNEAIILLERVKPLTTAQKNKVEELLKAL